MYVEIKIMMFGPSTLIPFRRHICSLDEKEKKSWEIHSLLFHTKMMCNIAHTKIRYQLYFSTDCFDLITCSHLIYLDDTSAISDKKQYAKNSWFILILLYKDIWLCFFFTPTIYIFDYLITCNFRIVLFMKTNCILQKHHYIEKKTNPAVLTVPSRMEF